MSAARVALVLSIVAYAAPTAAIPLLSGFGGPSGYGTPDHCLAPSDDGAWRAPGTAPDGPETPVDLRPAFPDGISLFGVRVHGAFINVDGVVTFAAPAGPFAPWSVPQLGRPMIAPWHADADLRGGTTPTRNNVCFHLEPERFVVTWNNVGAHDAGIERLNDFQLVVTFRSRCANPGDSDIEFRYNRCAWTTGEPRTPGGGDVHALVGFDAGNLRNYVVVPLSRMAAVARMCTESNVPGGEAGLWRFQIRSSILIGLCAGAGTRCEVPARRGICAHGVVTCDGLAAVCTPVTSPLDERCNNVDDDCDGAVDEGAVCPTGNTCLWGACVARCDAGVCAAGLRCDEADRCVDPACAHTTCSEETRCEHGVCGDACDGVSCPSGQRCVVGRCVDACETTRCIPRGTCDPALGHCVDDCACTGCATGERCMPEGRCVQEACVGIVCPAGYTCREGRCADRCDVSEHPVACPHGERCHEGRCVPVVALPPTSSPDAGPTMDSGGMSDVPEDNPEDLGLDGNALSRAPGLEGCGCRAACPRGGGGPWLAAILLLARRRRRRRAD